MPKNLKPELSESNEYYISKHRYYELKHFVMQYPDWHNFLKGYEGRYPRQLKLEPINALYFSDPTVEEAEFRECCRNKIKMVERCLEVAFEDLMDPITGEWKSWELRYDILTAIVRGKSYEFLKATKEVPFGREYYYKRYRKFYWLLDKVRG